MIGDQCCGSGSAWIPFNSPLDPDPASEYGIGSSYLNIAPEAEIYYGQGNFPNKIVQYVFPLGHYMHSQLKKANTL